MAVPCMVSLLQISGQVRVGISCGGAGAEQKLTSEAAPRRLSKEGGLGWTRVGGRVDCGVGGGDELGTDLISIEGR